MIGPTCTSVSISTGHIVREESHFWAYHERAEVKHEVEGLICPSLVQEHNVSDDSGLDSLHRSISYRAHD